MDRTAILGLSFNTRLLGLAVISGSDLLDYRIQLRKEAWSPRKRELILASLEPWCNYYSIKSVVLSIPHEKQTSSQTKELIESLKGFFSKKKVCISTYSAKSFLSLCPEAKTKKEVMRVLAFQYPELLYHYHKEVRNKNKYYVKLFEAVGIATIHAKRLDKNV